MQCLLGDPSAILAFYNEESSFHNILLGYFRQPNKNLYIIPITLKWMKQPSLSDKFVHQPEGLVAIISAIHRIEHYPVDRY